MWKFLAIPSSKNWGTLHQIFTQDSGTKSGSMKVYFLSFSTYEFEYYDEKFHSVKFFFLSTYHCLPHTTVCAVYSRSYTTCRSILKINISDYMWKEDFVNLGISNRKHQALK